MTKYAANSVEAFHLMDIPCVAMLVAEHRKLLEDYNILLKDRDTLAQNNRAAYEAQNNELFNTKKELLDLTEGNNKLREDYKILQLEYADRYNELYNLKAEHAELGVKLTETFNAFESLQKSYESLEKDYANAHNQAEKLEIEKEELEKEKKQIEQENLTLYKRNEYYLTQINDDRWRNAVLDKLADYGMDVPLSTSPKEMLNQIIQEAILMSKDLLINKVRVMYETTKDSRLTGRSSVPVKRIEQEDDGSFSIIIDGWPENAVLNHGKYIQQFAPEVFVIFDPQTDGYHIIGVSRSLTGAKDILFNYINYESNAAAIKEKEETVEGYYGEAKVPKGYTAEELERDNPYNQWMYE